MSTVPTVTVQQRQPGCLLTLLWFILVGWWASGIWIAVAWLLVVLIITMPFGLMMINLVPLVATLRRPATEYTATASGGLAERSIPQRPFLLRALYFILIGWWFSGLWMAVAWGASVTLIGIPLAIFMYNRVPAITTLRRY